MKRVALLLAPVVLLFGALGSVRADYAVFDQKNFSNSGVTSPYAEVTITGNTSTGQVTFKVDVINNPGATIGGFGFNTNLSSEVASVTVNSGVNWGTVQTNSAMDGFGKFSYHISGSGNSDSVATATVTVQLNVGHFSDALASNFEGLSTGGEMFAAEYFPNNGGATGFVATDHLSPNPVPAPPSYVLLGIGAIGLLALSPWRRKLAAA